MNKISILIVNYNTDELTVKAVASVNKHVQNISYEIIVVDNNSSKSTKLKTLLKDKPNTNFYQLEKNIGFGRANNYAYSKSCGDYIFLLNSDAYLITNIFPQLIKAMQENVNIACLSPNIVSPDNELNVSHGNFLSKRKIRNDLGFIRIPQEQLKEITTSKVCNFKELKEVDYITGAAMFLRRSIIEKLGFFDSSYFMYYEDMELCYRYKKAGFSSAVLPECTVVHIGGQSYLNTNFFKIKSFRVILRSKYIFSKNILSPFKSKLYYALFLFQAYKSYFIISFKKAILKIIR